MVWGGRDLIVDLRDLGINERDRERTYKRSVE
jgi:hypothetical protein